jgi:hypothetical protein
LALITTALLPATVRAAGFSGSFDPANWSIVNTTNGSVDETLTSNGSPPDYTCFTLNDVACVENISAASGAVDVVGSSSAGGSGGGTANTVRTTTWTVTNGAAAALLNFDWALTTLPSGGATNQSVSYLVGLSETPISSRDGGSGSFSGLNSIALAAGESFGFRVTTTDNNGDYGTLSITNFDAVNTTTLGAPNVPAPLPLAGGITAFSWSRRLRRRIRQRHF